MTTKPTKATLSTEVQLPAAAPAPVAAVAAAPEAAKATVDVRPNFIVLTDYTFKVFPAAVALIRSGWSISTAYPPVTFEATGFSTITLDRTKIAPEVTEAAYQIAEQEEALAAQRAAIDYEYNVQQAAAAIVAKEKKDAAAAALAAEIAAKRAALQALEAAAAAA